MIDRHESFVAEEVFRVLITGGHFVTQQAGSDYYSELNEFLGARPIYSAWTLDMASRQLAEAGFNIREKHEALVKSCFNDVGVVICYLRAVPWQIPDFSVQKYRRRLYELHRKIRRNGGLKVTSKPFYIEAIKG